MRRRVPAALACLLVTASFGASAAPLEERLDAALSSRGLRGARIGALVVDGESGRVLYARWPDRPLVPASNLKVLTAIAALSALGPAHRFTTEILADAPPDAEGSVGILMIRGGGDPALTSEEIWRLAADLRRLGLRRVRDGLLLDASAFDAERWHPSWGAVSARAYHAPVSAISVNYGAFAAVVAPGSAVGDRVSVQLDPPVPFLRLVNRGVTGPTRSAPTLAVDRRTAGAVEDVVVTGRARAGAEPRTYYRSVLDPVGYAGAVLRMQLAANGIVVEGETRRGIVPVSAHPLHVFEGRPLAEIVRLFVKYSNNAIAETLLKVLGAREGDGPTTWARGIAAVRSQLAGLGLSMEGLTLVDGSGLSYDNRVPPRLLVEALRVARRSFRFGPEFVSALPIAATDGTLEERAERAALAVRAKTGLLTRVTGLSGYAEGGDGRVLVFCVLANGYRGSAEAAMNGIDRFVAEVATPAAETAALDAP
jgi:D-alanyl-D-alanine carboxypeptidase/D-alanyl-D-alanine-endopeptidase (penicillin-binding protein 4)